MTSRGPRLAGLAAAVVILMSAVACGGTADIKSVADFDSHPCALLPEDTMAAVVSPPYKDLAGVDVAPKGTKASANANDTYACTYSYTAAQAPEVPEVSSMTVTVAHTRSGSQPFAICAAGTTAKAGGYRAEDIGDQACVSPSNDLWMRIGNDFYHIVVVPQPGFASPIDASQALADILTDVARATAVRMPKS
jgi:hypothetical protein